MGHGLPGECGTGHAFESLTIPTAGRALGPEDPRHAGGDALSSVLHPAEIAKTTPGTKRLPKSIRLRHWQKTALDRFIAKTDPDFLAVATPGAGKTTFALAAARRQLLAERQKVIVIAPTAHLKRQWAAAAAALDIHLDPDWSPSAGRLPADMHGIVTTYQQVASSWAALGRLAKGAFVIFDELHHAGEDRAWGECLRHAFTASSKRLALSGTPFRSDTRAIPFVNYQGDEAVPDFEYGYGDALADGRVVRPVYFPRTNGHMEWSAPDGANYSATFDDALDNVRANQRLRTALSLEGHWLPEVLDSAHARLCEIREHQPDAGGLVIAMDQDHARGIAALLSSRFGTEAAVATSDEADASARIAAFAGGKAPWLVAVRMVSEGVDIPRLRVGVYATTTTTELFFRQAVGRFVRWVPGVGRQRAYVFIPDDPRLRARADQISQRRRHSLRRDGHSVLDEDAELPRALKDPAQDPKGDDQLSLFAVISAVATDKTAPAEDHADTDLGSHDEADDSDASLLLELDALPPLAGRTDPEVGGEGSGTRKELKGRLREANTTLARAVARRTGWPHAQVNAELNRLSGVAKVTEATVEQLENRRRHAERWLGRL